MGCKCKGVGVLSVRSGVRAVLRILFCALGFGVVVGGALVIEFYFGA